jgi:pyruvate ferredoxin oxidoreductase delta subunit
MMKEKAAIATASEGASGMTGMWRIQKPVMEEGKCNKCLMCWLYCPEAAIVRGKDGRIWITYEYCKGCGICSEVCPTKVIKMVKEV